MREAGKRCGLKDSAALNLKRRIAADLIAFFGEDIIRRLLDGVRPGWESDLRTVRERHGCHVMTESSYQHVVRRGPCCSPEGHLRPPPLVPKPSEFDTPAPPETPHPPRSSHGLRGGGLYFCSWNSPRSGASIFYQLASIHRNTKLPRQWAVLANEGAARRSGWECGRMVDHLGTLACAARGFCTTHYGAAPTGRNRSDDQRRAGELFSQTDGGHVQGRLGCLIGEEIRFRQRRALSPRIGRRTPSPGKP